ncbi:hypothetical protein JL39_03065 [Rhizobium sp. YS-1r]|nr:hypothetical protein JL39_03065 [Rhizobium sp. YS-1r]
MVDPRVVDPEWGLSYLCLRCAGTGSLSAFRPLFMKLLSGTESANELRNRPVVPPASKAWSMKGSSSSINRLTIEVRFSGGANNPACARVRLMIVLLCR